jgi:septal ring factor EnvC (AmiA/AmiB activator)
VYVPVVEKEVKWSKRCKDPALVGTTKEIIHQVSHSKKWPRFRGTKGEWVNSYSLLQDRFFEGMRAAGFHDFERGERGSTTEHLTDLEYKITKDKERLKKLDGKIEAKKEVLEKIVELTKAAKDITAHYRDIDEMAKPSLFGKKVELTAKNWESVSNLAKGGYLSRSKIENLRTELAQTKRERDKYKSLWEDLKEKTRSFLTALELFPQRVKDFLADLIREHQQAKEARRIAQRAAQLAARPQRTRNKDRGHVR